MTRHIQVVKELFNFPEGKQFLAACLITIMGLVTALVYVERRYENNTTMYQNEINKCNQNMVEHLIKDTEREAAIKDRELRKKDRLDSIEEILNFNKKYKVK